MNINYLLYFSYLTCGELKINKMFCVLKTNWHDGGIRKE